ncbi:MAG: response regulator [bacterium]|jgi:two-component system response regulator YesN|nr:response regulator [Chitinophagaceae bacterium]
MNELKYAVICVDDDPYILQMLGFQLEKFIEKRTTVIEFFTDPLEAIKNIKQLVAEKIEILFVVVDYQMPHMTGAELVRSLKDLFPEMKFIMLSGQASAIHVDDLVNDNLLESFVSKPWDEKELYSITEGILKKVHN